MVLPLTIIALAQSFSPISVAEISTSVPEVDQLVDATTTMSVEEAPSSPIPTKRGRDEDKSYLPLEFSPKWTRLPRDNASVEVTPFLQMLNILSSQVVCTSKAVAAIESMLDMFFVQNIYKEETMELVSEFAHIIYWATYMFFVVTIGRGDVLAHDNPSKEREKWKGKCEAMEHKCSSFQKDLAEVQKKVDLTNSLQMRWRYTTPLLFWHLG